MGLTLRSLAILAVAGLLGACGDGPTAPGALSPVPTGDVILRLSYLSSCTLAGPPILPEVRTRVTVTKNGADWVGTAASAASGDIQFRFHQSASSPAGTLVEGTIAGTAIHLPELFPAPSSEARMAIGSAGQISGVAFGPGAISTSNGVDGTGTGTVTLSDSAGRSCSGARFGWALFPPQT